MSFSDSQKTDEKKEMTGVRARRHRRERRSTGIVYDNEGNEVRILNSFKKSTLLDTRLAWLVLSFFSFSITSH